MSRKGSNIPRVFPQYPPLPIPRVPENFPLKFPYKQRLVRGTEEYYDDFDRFSPLIKQMTVTLVNYRNVITCFEYARALCLYGDCLIRLVNRNVPYPDFNRFKFGSFIMNNNELIKECRTAILKHQRKRYVIKSPAQPRGEEAEIRAEKIVKDLLMNNEEAIDNLRNVLAPSLLKYYGNWTQMEICNTTKKNQDKEPLIEPKDAARSRQVAREPSKISNWKDNYKTNEQTTSSPTKRETTNLIDTVVKSPLTPNNSVKEKGPKDAVTFDEIGFLPRPNIRTPDSTNLHNAPVSPGDNQASLFADKNADLANMEDATQTLQAVHCEQTTDIEMSEILSVSDAEAAVKEANYLNTANNIQAGKGDDEMELHNVELISDKKVYVVNEEVETTTLTEQTKHTENEELIRLDEEPRQSDDGAEERKAKLKDNDEEIRITDSDDNKKMEGGNVSRKATMKAFIIEKPSEPPETKAATAPKKLVLEGLEDGGKSKQEPSSNAADFKLKLGGIIGKSHTLYARPPAAKKAPVPERHSDDEADESKPAPSKKEPAKVADPKKAKPASPLGDIKSKLGNQGFNPAVLMGGPPPPIVRQSSPANVVSPKETKSGSEVPTGSKKSPVKKDDADGETTGASKIKYSSSYSTDGGDARSNLRHITSLRNKGQPRRLPSSLMKKFSGGEPTNVEKKNEDKINSKEVVIIAIDENEAEEKKEEAPLQSNDNSNNNDQVVGLERSSRLVSSDMKNDMAISSNESIKEVEIVQVDNVKNEMKTSDASLKSDETKKSTSSTGSNKPTPPSKDKKGLNITLDKGSPDHAEQTKL